MEKSAYLELKGIIDYHMDKYYNQDDPEIEDYEYDQLMVKLRAMEKEHPEWISKDSPTQKIGGTIKREAGAKVVHNVPMLSIEDVFTKAEVVNWLNKILSTYPNSKFSVEMKIDGLSLSLRYKRIPGKDKMELILAETRGDGMIGEDSTANALTIPDILKTLDLDYDYLELRGEVYMTHEDFNRFNEKQEKLKKKLAANPRNLAAGTLRQLDTNVTRERNLRMFVFNVQDGPTEIMSSHVKGLEMLEKKGIPVVYHKLCSTAEEVIKCIDEIGEMRRNLPYDIDGAVVKLDETSLRAHFPSASKYSSGHIAYKYPPEERIVVMDDILVNVGRTGKLTFTGVFHDRETGKAVQLCGTKVQRATLHNQDYIDKMTIGIGGEYKLVKSGEIIPKLNGCVTRPESVFKAPKRCPICGGILEREVDTADIRCNNSSCAAQLSRAISYFSSVECMNIVGLGETLIDALISKGYLRNYADIYKLKEHRESLIKEKIIGKEKSTDKVLAAIEASKSNDPVRLLTALGIRNVGKSTAREILIHYTGIEAIMNATIKDLTAIPDVGITTAQAIYDFFNNTANKEVISELRQLGVNMNASDKKMGKGKLEGMTIVVTGTLPTLGRKEVEALIVSNGGKCTGSVSKKTNLLVAGDAAGSKLEKAQQLGIRVISEKELLGIIETD